MCTTCHCGQSEPAVITAPSPSARRLELGAALLSRNDAVAASLRRRFTAAGLPVLNLLSSPGSGKTALLERLGRDWSGSGRLGAIVGDLATDNDARRLRAAGIEAVQITTGQACHLEAAMLEPALERFDLAALELLVIENVGNLVCPAAYDLGESLRLVLLSVTEGEDKPLKYPAMFHSADLVVINKIDLAAAVDFDRDHARRHIAKVAPAASIVEVSARTGEGMDALRDAITAGLAAPALA
ncbi:hydrogenase nickel incorporation protein HypB [Cyanobium sp. LEGE 06113]|uniref:hydrogenase nickel incorporation protein HypB n=1 Tax=Cyanobium sp. LEGE 06113 TaxID=1297573 RepID=UPI001880D4E8|nr:hydrogenase nickel incorporation protein HypB [Cyanobium sp. LEGE 06113]MBE9155074.1 hydrogenase nickel incorporation protein HypB [Cyanobium sp. LEGE 06113]